MIRNRSHQQHTEVNASRSSSLVASEPPGYWSSHFVLELESALGQASDPAVMIDKVTSAGHLLYLHYVDRLEWFDAERVISRVVDLPGADRKTTGDGPFDLVNTLHAIHLSLWGKNRLGGGSAFGRVGPRASIRRTQLAEGARAAISLASGDYENAVHLAEKAKRALVRTKAPSAIDRLMLSWWDEIVIRANDSLRPAPVSSASATTPLIGRLIAFPVERVNFAPVGDRFAWDPGVPSDFRAEWIWRQRPTADLSA